jgi:hypothetical protein
MLLVRQISLKIVNPYLFLSKQEVRPVFSMQVATRNLNVATLFTRRQHPFVLYLTGFYHFRVLPSGAHLGGVLCAEKDTRKGGG